MAAETEAGRVRFRRPQRYLRRARTFDKLKVLLDEIETEWADSQQTSRPRVLMKTRQLPSSVDVSAYMRKRAQSPKINAAKRGMSLGPHLAMIILSG